jgi:malate dehydrogenase (oxaloacetate-decarboxylating)(NADP+)
MISTEQQSSAALLNALELAGKEATYQNSGFRSNQQHLACANLYVLLGINPDNIIMFDKDGVIFSERNRFVCFANKYIQRETDDFEML